MPNNYQYYGKELQQNEFSDGTGLEDYDYGFRGYDPQLGRFTEQDPLTDNFATVTPYQCGLNDPVANIDADGLSPLNLLCPANSGFTVFLLRMGEASSQIASSPLTRALSYSVHGLSVADLVGNTLVMNDKLNNFFIAPEVGGAANTGTGTEGVSSENIGENDGGPGRPLLLPIVPFKFIEAEGKWAVGVIDEFIDPIVQNAKTLFKGTNPNGSKATTFQRVNAGINFIAQTATLGGKGESEEGFDEVGEETENAENATNTLDQYTDNLTQLADQAEPAGNRAPNAMVRGTLIHTRWEELAKQEYGEAADVEQSFLKGVPQNRNTPGSIRVDLIIKSPEGKPIGIFDLKTGKAGLTPARINQIRSNLPPDLKYLPIQEIRLTR